MIPHEHPHPHHDCICHCKPYDDRRLWAKLADLLGQIEDLEEAVADLLTHLHEDLGWDDLDGDDDTDNTEITEWGTITYNNVKEYIDNFFDIYNDFLFDYLSILLGVGDGTKLTVGEDYEFETANDWYFSNSDYNYPLVYVSQVSDTVYLVRTKTYAAGSAVPVLSHDTLSQSSSETYPSVCFRHSGDDGGELDMKSRLYGIEFIGDYAFLNDATFSTSTSRTNATEYMNASPSSYRMSWSYISYVSTSKMMLKDFSIDAAFTMGLSSFFDGYNTQFSAYGDVTDISIGGIMVDRQFYATISS